MKNSVRKKTVKLWLEKRGDPESMEAWRFENKIEEQQMNYLRDLQLITLKKNELYNKKAKKRPATLDRIGKQLSVSNEAYGKSHI